MDAAAENAQPLTWGRVPYEHPGKWWGTGNRCGHNPAKGEFERYCQPLKKGRLPATLQALVDGAKAYYTSPGLLPTLANLNGKANADGNPRCNRSEARAAESLVLSAIIQFTEFASLRVGTPLADGGFKHRSCAEIARVAGLLAPGSTPEAPEPSQRFWRAFRRLKLAGAFTVHLQHEVKADGTKRARPAVKLLNPDFLLALGRVGYQKFKEFRDWCSNRIKKARRKHREQHPKAYDAAQARSRLAMAGSGPRAMQKQRRGKADLPDVDESAEAQRRYNLAMIAYIKEVSDNNPGASYAEIRQLARIKFPPWEEHLDRQRRH